MTVDMLATMAFLRDSAPNTVGIHVTGRPDINGAKLQEGIRFLFARTAAPAPIAAPVALAKVSKHAGAKRRTGPAPGTAGAILAAVRRVVRAAAPRGTVPTLQCVRITVRNGIATLAATDMERHISETLEWPAHDCDGITDAKALRDVLRTMPADSLVTLAKAPDMAGTVTVKGVATPDAPGPFTIGNATLAAGFMADYPEVGIGALPHEFTMSAERLRALLARPAHAMSDEPVRYYLNGVALQVRPDGMRCVATDGYRAVRVDIPTPEGAGKMPDIIIPKAAVADLLALLDKSDGVARVQISDTRIRVTLGTLVYLSKLVDGSFPDYERVMPRAESHDNVCALDKAGFIAAVKAAAVGADVTGRAGFAKVKLAFSHGGDSAFQGCRVSAEDSEGNAAWRDAPAPLGVTFNLEIGAQAKYLLDMVGAMTGNPVFRFKPETSAPGSPFLIQDSADPDSAEVIMPFRL